MKIKKRQHGDGNENKPQFWFNCPGCKQEHAFGESWEFNQDYDNPTISPSILVTARYYNGEIKHDLRCHSFIKAGQIQFLNDCSHSLAGQTIELPEYET